MSFGKRGASPSPRGPDNGAAEASPLWRQLRTIGIGVAVGLGIAAFNFALLPYIGRAQEKRFEQQLDGGYAHALSGKSDWAKTLRVYCSPPGTLRRASASTRDEFDPMRRALLEQGEELKTRASFLTCTLTHARERFCNAEARGATVDQVKEYLSRRREGVRLAARAVGTTASQLEAHYRATAEEYGGEDNMKDPDAPSWQVAAAANLRSLVRLDPDLIAALRTLIEDGYFTTADFSGFLGLFMPAELEPHIINAAAKGRPCT
jgi:hypothetical protein